MKKQDNTSRKNKTILIIISILILASISIYFILNNKDSASDNTISNSSEPSKESQEDATDEIKPTDKSEKTKTSNQQQTSANAEITYVYQDVENIKIGTLITAVTSDGTCSLEMKKDDKTYSETVGVHPLANSSTCKGFTVPLDQLESGDWNIIININLNGETINLQKTFNIN